MSYMDLFTHYKVMFDMKRYHHYTMEEVESMLPFERELYIDLILNAIKEEKELQSKQQ